MKLTPAKVTLLMLVAVGSLIGMYVIKGLFAVEKKVVRACAVGQRSAGDGLPRAGNKDL